MFQLIKFMRRLLFSPVLPLGISQARCGKRQSRQKNRVKTVKILTVCPICERATNYFYDGRCEKASGEDNKVNCRRENEEDHYRPS